MRDRLSSPPSRPCPLLFLFFLHVSPKQRAVYRKNSRTGTRCYVVFGLEFVTWTKNHLRWQLIADHNERPSRIQWSVAFLLELVGTTSLDRNYYIRATNLLVSPGIVFKRTWNWENIAIKQKKKKKNSRRAWRKRLRSVETILFTEIPKDSNMITIR